MKKKLVWVLYACLLALPLQAFAVASTHYSRDRTGRMLSKTEGGQTTTYGYDALYRLKTVDAPGTTEDEAYTYDKVGNRKTMTKGGTTKAYDYDTANRLKTVRQGSETGALLAGYVHDLSGRRVKHCAGGTVTRSDTACTGATVKAYTWDGQGRLSEAQVTGKPGNGYRYDPNGYRVGKYDSQGNRIYLLEGEHLEAVYSGTNLQAKYLRGAVIDEVVNGYQFDANGKWTNTTFHHDPLQSVVGLSGHNGDVLNLASYGPFGETQAQSGNVGNFLQYTGREKDPDTGLYQVRARYYDPETGRFISRDPIGFAGGINQYVYCGADPVNANDPSGLDPVSAAVKLGGRLGNALTRDQNKGVGFELIWAGWRRCFQKCKEPKREHRNEFQQAKRDVNQRFNR
jgi:RHS repeat-associated protein